MTSAIMAVVGSEQTKKIVGDRSKCVLSVAMADDEPHEPLSTYNIGAPSGVWRRSVVGLLQAAWGDAPINSERSEGDAPIDLIKNHVREREREMEIIFPPLRAGQKQRSHIVEKERLMGAYITKGYMRIVFWLSKIIE